MKGDATRELETAAFRTLNAVVEPLVRAGVGGPLLAPLGAISLEVTGRTSGRLYRVPLLATVVGQVTVVATFRGRRSEWVKNLAAADAGAWWVNGVRKEGRAVVFAPGVAEPASGDVPAVVRGCMDGWRGLVAMGWAVAVLVEGAQ